VTGGARPATELRAIFADAVAAMASAPRVAAALAGVRWPREVAVVAVGKAALAMACGAAGVPAARGLVVAPAPGDAPWPVLVAAHPVPDARSEAAGRALLALAASVPADGLLLALISGGASALAAVPAAGLSLAEKVARTRAAQAAGLPIGELNRLRTSLSALKGGRLAAACPAPVWTLVASDVVGDDPAVVGSGPTVAAWTGRAGSLIEALPEVPREGAIEARGDRVVVVAGVADLAAAAVAAAAARGVAGRCWTGALTGDVADVARRAVAALDGGLVVASGEPTLALPPAPGQGGRACHLALHLARAIAGRAATCLVAGSDGIDGTGPAAGAVVDGSTWARLAAAGVDGDAALAGCDSGAALAAIGATVVTGPTGVNHADLLLLHGA
jgi:glycerate 2-kinase